MASWGRDWGSFSVPGLYVHPTCVYLHMHMPFITHIHRCFIDIRHQEMFIGHGVIENNINENKDSL